MKRWVILALDLYESNGHTLELFIGVRKKFIKKIFAFSQKSEKD